VANEYKKARIYLKGEDKTDSVQDIRCVGEKYEITFKNGKLFTYNVGNVRLVESALNAEKSRNCFDYLKHIATAIGLSAKVENGAELNILAQNYSKIDFVDPDSMLGTFLGGKLPEAGPESSNAGAAKEPEPIYPFGFNASQKDAVDKALTSKLSVIEGPPGTGKTQTILNIIANAIMRGDSVAVVSSNNSATKNVFEKLQKYEVDFIAAYLGNAKNKKDFISSQKLLPDMSKWALGQQPTSALYQALKLRYRLLHEKLAKKNELSVLKQELSDVETEQKHFLQYSERIVTLPESASAKPVDSSRQALEMWLWCEIFEEVVRGKGLVAFIKYILEQLGLIGRRVKEVRELLQTYPREYLVAVFQQQFYELKIAELNRKISALMLDLASFDFDKKMREYSEISMRLFRAKLAEQYVARKRGVYGLDDLWRNSENFIKDYPVILSTTYSLRSSLSSRVMYDYAIIDESSQVDLCTGALALSCARKAVVVGDLKQLPNVVDSESAALTDTIFAKFGLPEVYRYKTHSLLSAVTEMFTNVPSTLLREHYRCHPKIIEFCNRKFYDNQLIILTESKSDREPLVVYKTAEGNHARNRVNQRQIDIIKREVIPQQKLNTNNGSVGIVTPYRNQTNALQKAFEGMSVKADTVDKFQGQENEIIILSTVDNAITEFADNANRLNVAVSRAIEQLIVVVSADDVQSDTNIGDLVRYIEYHNFMVIKSAVYSVFDYLYKSYAERRRTFLATQKRVSEYDSENLFYALIQDILKREPFRRFDVAVHVPLQMIIRDTSILTKPEKQYASNIRTHVDFLIYDKTEKLRDSLLRLTAWHFIRKVRGSRRAI
jgi:RecA/RadA recombinase